MFVAYVVIAILLALLLTVSGTGKLRRDERQVASFQKIGVPLTWMPPLAACEFAGALGLVGGALFAPLGIAAAIGVVLYFVGAAISHLRAKDFSGLATPLPILAAAIAALTLRALTA